MATQELTVTPAHEALGYIPWIDIVQHYMEQGHDWATASKMADEYCAKESASSPN